MRFLLDEDLPPKAAEISRGLGLDAVGVHELGRRSLPDEAQLGLAAREERIFVTRNRDDFRTLTLEFYRAEEHITEYLSSDVNCPTAVQIGWRMPPRGGSSLVKDTPKVLVRT